MENVIYIIMIAICIVSIAISTALDRGFIAGLGFVIAGVVYAVYKIILWKKQQKAEGIKKEKNNTQILLYVCSIGSILFAHIWYISLILSVPSLIVSIKEIQRTGKKSPKATMIISIIGIVYCILVYTKYITLVLKEFLY